MRRPLPAAVITTAALTAVLLIGSGCAAERPKSEGQAPSGTAAPTVSGSAEPGAGASPGASGMPPARSSEAPGGATGGPGVPAPPPPALPPAGGNAKEVCAAALKTNTDLGTAFITEMVTVMQATSDGDTAAATAARGRAEKGLADWTAALRGHATKATDATLKSTLGELATQVSTMKPEANSIDEIKLESLNERIGQLCQS
ncbi:hypothetical protein [Micromonospora sp. NBC_01796]|uniref:hypothetical protein n=1 Tax=Micromonospora sp. NBC_01796 TaxID=2975987 RepID=UPI002DDAF74F|nr:hypothetical protein [Micromonospora sp. NBC_01796]WSA82901.1 hypothetical protein OIE47_20930 [Micromonospora sp. NBC_01796]